MRNECNIIRDILPLYADKMVSADTASFVEEHLIGCAECRAELEKLKVADVIESAVSDAENDDEKRLKAFAGKINRKRHIVISAFAAVLLIIFLSYNIPELSTSELPFDAEDVQEIYYDEEAETFK